MNRNAHSDPGAQAALREAMERYWQRFAALGYRSPDRFAYSKARTLNGVDLKGKRVLDLGCGDGMKGIYLALSTRAAEWVAVDEYAGAGSDAENRSRFRENLAEIRAPNVRQVLASIQANPFRSESFDAVVAIDVCHHFIETPERIMRGSSTFEAFRGYFVEIRRLLKPGGVLILRDLSRHHISEILPVNQMPIVWTTKHDASEWARLLEAVGFEAIAWNYYVPFRLQKYRAVLDNRWMNYFLKSRYTIVARSGEADRGAP